MLDAQPEVGSTANRYEVLAKLASGGMAEIFLARTQSSAGVERYVVLKRVHKHRATDIKFVHMFLDEARLASQLQHPNIAQVFDTGKLGDTYFFTMEYVHGETVRELLHRSYDVQRPIPIGCTLTIIAGAAAALQHAHDRVGHDGLPLGIVHRDVSPSNLIVSYEGNVKIVDFGVAKAAHRSVETQSGTVKGKMGYMAPEQCRGGAVDRRCDLFSLGIVMWELLVGERLFKRATDFESMEAVVSEPTPPPSSLRPEVPPTLDAVVLKLLAKAARDRYQTADEVLEALEAVATSTGNQISVAGVRRYLRDLFGQPQEPWIELRRGAEKEEAVTVTGAPINGRPDMLELEGDELDRLRDLSAVVRDSMPIRVPVAAIAAAKEPTSNGETTSDMRPLRRRRWPIVAALLGSAMAVATTGYVVATRPASTVSSDAAPVAISLDAANATPPPDAMVVVTAPVDAAGPDAPSPTVFDPKQIAALVRDKRFVDVVAMCEATSPLPATSALDCTLAACRIHDHDLARTFLARVASKTQRATITQCGRLGTPLRPSGTARVPAPDPPHVDPPVKGDGSGSAGANKKPDCDDPDPMACRK